MRKRLRRFQCFLPAHRRDAGHGTRDARAHRKLCNIAQYLCCRGGGARAECARKIMIHIPSSGQFLEEVELRRQKGAPPASTRAVAGAAHEFAALAAPVLEDILVESEDFEERVLSNAETVRDVCIDLALMAEDLLSGGFLWRIIEDYNARLLGSPLPLVVPFSGAAGGESGGAKFSLGGRREAPPNSLNLPSGNLALPGDALPALDERRFQFFLFTMWPYYAPGVHVLADDGALMELASLAARFFKRLRGGAVSPGAFLSEPDSAHDAIDGSGVKTRTSMGLRAARRKPNEPKRPPHEHASSRLGER